MTRAKRKSYPFLIVVLLMTAGLGYTAWRTFQWVQSKRLGPPLIAAIKANDSPKAIKLLGSGADANARDVPNPPLDFMSLIKSIFRPDPRLTSGSWPTALQLALDSAKTDNEATLQQERQSSFEIVRALLAHRADARVTVPEGNSLLAYLLGPQVYATNRDPRVFSLLLDAGADPNAIWKGREDVYPYNGTYRPISKPLLLLAYEWQHETWHDAKRGEFLNLLLDHKANPNVRDLEGRTLLKRALDDDRTDLVQKLLDAGADPNLKSEGRPPIFDAVQWRNSAAAKMLLAKRADPNQVDLLRTSPLMVAAFNGDQDIVEALLAAGARSDLVDSEGKTVRQFAADSPRILALLDTARRP